MKSWILGLPVAAILGLPTALPSGAVPAPIVRYGASTCLGNCHADADALRFIEDQETFVPVPYQDGAGYWTVGVGHRILPGDKLDYPLMGDVAAALLKNDVGRSERFLNRAVRVPLAQHEFNPLCSIVFNVGPGKAGKADGIIELRRGGPSSLLGRLNAGDRSGAAAHFVDWNKITVKGRKVPSPGLTKRRRREAALFLLGE